MENDINTELTQQQTEALLALSPIEIMDKYCEGTLKIIESEIGVPVHINVHRKSETKSHQDFKTSLHMTMIIGKLQYIGMYYSKVNNSVHINPLDYGLKLFLLNFIASHKSGFFSENQFVNTKKLIIEYILDGVIENVKKYFLIGYDHIPQYEMLFLLYEFAYCSPIHQSIYNFQGNDIRRTTIGRIELTTMNKYQDHRLNINNVEDQLLDSIANFTYNVEEIVDIIFVQKEVQYRTSVLNEIYFNFEHFLSVIIKTFKMADETLGKKKLKNKQEYLSRVLNELKIEQHIDYKIISDEIQKRCIESSSKYLDILKQDTKQKISLIDVFHQIINMRNSLHSNGASNKDINAFDIGKLHFNEVKKDEQFSSMAMHQLIALMVISTYTIEIIVKKLSEVKKINNVSVPEVIIDKYVEEKRRVKAIVKNI
jgi:hypothetical protein